MEQVYQFFYRFFCVERRAACHGKIPIPFWHGWILDGRLTACKSPEWSGRSELEVLRRFPRRFWMPFARISVIYICTLIVIAVEGIDRQFLRAEDTVAFCPDDTTLERAQALQKVYFLQPTQADHDDASLVKRLYTKQLHQQIGLALRWDTEGRAPRL